MHLFSFSATTRFVQCDKCNHFFLILSESDTAKRYIHVKYDKASGSEAEKQSKALQSPPPPPRKVCIAASCIGHFNNLLVNEAKFH